MGRDPEYIGASLHIKPYAEMPSWPLQPFDYRSHKAGGGVLSHFLFYLLIYFCWETINLRTGSALSMKLDPRLDGERSHC